MKRITRKFLRIIFTLLALIVIPYAALYVYVNEQGKDLLVNALSKKLDTKVELDTFSFSFPFRVTLVDLKVEGLQANQIVADLGFSNFFTSTYVLHKLYLNGCTYTITDENVSAFVPPSLPEPVQTVSNAGFVVSPEAAAGIKIKELWLKDCNVVLKLEKAEPPLILKLVNISGRIDDLEYPDLDKFYADIYSGISINGFSQDDVLFLKGWIDWPNKNMDISFKVDTINYFMLDPYYPPFWKTSNLELKTAFMTVDSKLTAQNDDLLIDYRIILEEFAFKDKPEDPNKIKNFETVLALLSQGEKPFLHLRHKTKMSAPTFKVTFIGEGLLDQLKAIDEEKSKDTFNYYMDKSRDLLESGMDKFRALTLDPPVKAVGSLFEEFLKNVSRVFNIKTKTEKESGEEAPAEEKP